MKSSMSRAVTARVRRAVVPGRRVGSVAVPCAVSFVVMPESVDDRPSTLLPRAFHQPPGAGQRREDAPRRRAAGAGARSARSGWPAPHAAGDRHRRLTFCDHDAVTYTFGRLHHVQLAARGGCWFAGGGVEVHLGVEAEFAPARKAHPGVLVDRPPRAGGRLQEAGASVAWDPEFPGHDRFYSADPFGNRLEFLEPSAEPVRAGPAPVQRDANQGRCRS